MNLQSIQIAIIAILGGICILLFNLWQGAHDEVTRIQSSLAQAQEQYEEDAKQQRVEHERILADTARGWSAAVDWHRAHPRTVRVLSPAKCDLPQAGAVPATSGGNEAVPAGSGEGRTISVEQCEQIANDSILDAEWIERAKLLTDQIHEASK